MRRERSSHIVWRRRPKAAFGRQGVMMHHGGMWPSGHYLRVHGWYTVRRGAWAVRWREPLHVLRRGAWRTLQWHQTGPRTQKTTGGNLEVPRRDTRGRTWRSTNLVA